jgi:hypothetical protein
LKVFIGNLGSKGRATQIPEEVIRGKDDGMGRAACASVTLQERSAQRDEHSTKRDNCPGTFAL